jgi:predicted secreted protein
MEYLDVDGKAGEAIALPLTNGPATGYSWRLDLPAGVERIEDSPGRELDPAVRLGGSEGRYLQVTAPKGEHVIVARLARPWEPDNPVRIVTIRLHVARRAPTDA